MASNECNTDVVKYFIVQPSTANGGDIISSGDTYTCSGITYTNDIEPCDPLSGVTISSGITVYSTEILPLTDNQINLGSNSKRFRNINTVSGNSSVWTSTYINTTELNLGLDSSGNTRTITADNSVIQDDILNGGGY